MTLKQLVYILILLFCGPVMGQQQLRHSSDKDSSSENRSIHSSRHQMKSPTTTSFQEIRRKTIDSNPPNTRVKELLHRLKENRQKRPTTSQKPNRKLQDTQKSTASPLLKHKNTSKKKRAEPHKTPQVQGFDVIKLREVVIIPPFKFDSRLERRKYMILRRKTMEVWPYAVKAAKQLNELQYQIDKLESNAQRRTYTKRVQEYIEGKFSERLKKLTKTQGQILVKLIYRQTGETAYNLVRELRSGWRAFWYNVTANLFTISLREKYDPYHVKQDYYIEHILRRAFQKGKLEYQEPAIEIDLGKIARKWH